jgi:predicted amidohydrolase
MKNFKKLIFRTIAITFIIIFLFAIEMRSQDQSEKSPVVISGLQMNVSDNINANMKLIEEGITKAAGEGAEFLVTPEGSLSGYTSNFDQKKLADALEQVKAKASQMKVGLMLGTCYKEQVKGREFCYNQVRVYSPVGDYLGAYSKILRCSNLDLPGSGEMVDYVEGDLRTFVWKGSRFGILICNDLWATPGYTTMPNPYLAWRLKQLGAQFIIHCINSGSAQRYRPFHESSAELWALSVKLPILEVNAVEQDAKVNAQSGLIDATGERSLRVPDSGVQFFTVRILPASSQDK